MAHKDPVTPELYQEVLLRDRIQMIKAGLTGRRIFCIAPVVDRSTLGTCSGRPTLDHIKDHAMMGRRAPSDAAHLVTLCEHHHIWSGWATSHRPALRGYLASVQNV